jgi:electron transport complex protein RnfG
LKKDFIMPILVLTLICLLMSSALAVGNRFTRPVIEKAAAERAEEARKMIIPGADEFVLLENPNLPRTVLEAYATSNDKGYIFIVTTVGYGGEFKIICGITPDGKVIGSAVLEHNETQGLGTIVFTKAADYDGLDSAGAEGIDAIAGSTITSRAYKNGIRDAFAAFETVRGARP